MSDLIFLDLEWNTAFYRDKSGERLPFHELIEVAAMNSRQKRMGYNAAQELLEKLGMVEPGQESGVDWNDF